MLKSAASPSYIARGTGGRSSFSGVIATVFGSTGFVGRYVVNRLGRIGSQVVVPWRGEEASFRHLKVMGDLGQIVPFNFSLRNQDSIEKAVSRSNVVINLLGRRWATRNFSLDEANHQSAINIAKAAKAAGVERFIHVSLLGASTGSHSAWSRSVAEGEKAIREIFPSAIIIRSSSVFGAEDRLLNMFAGMSSYWKFVPMVPNPGKIQPILVSDLATAIANAATNPEYGVAGHVYEIGGSEIYTWKEAAEKVLREMILSDNKVIEIPTEVQKLFLKYYEKTRLPRLTVEEMNFMREDSVVSPGALTIQDLGVKPRSLSVGAPFVYHYIHPEKQHLMKQQFLPSSHSL